MSQEPRSSDQFPINLHRMMESAADVAAGGGSALERAFFATPPVPADMSISDMIAQANASKGLVRQGLVDDVHYHLNPNGSVVDVHIKPKAPADRIMVDPKVLEDLRREQP